MWVNDRLPEGWLATIQKKRGSGQIDKKVLRTNQQKENYRLISRKRGNGSWKVQDIL